MEFVIRRIPIKFAAGRAVQSMGRAGFFGDARRSLLFACVCAILLCWCYHAFDCVVSKTTLRSHQSALANGKSFFSLIFRLHYTVFMFINHVFPHFMCSAFVSEPPLPRADGISDGASGEKSTRNETGTKTAPIDTETAYRTARADNALCQMMEILDLIAPFFARFIVHTRQMHASSPIAGCLVAARI